MRPGLAAYLARRVVAALCFIVIVSASAFVLARVAPGDATAHMRIEGADEAAIAAARARLGLDRSLAAHLADWFSHLARFDLGISSRFDRPVADLVAERAVNTARLAAVALAIATLVGLPLGVLTGARPRGLLAAVVTPISIALVSCPPLVGALGLLFLAVSTGWLSTAPGHVALPAVALGLPVAAMLERLQSQATGDAMAAPDLVAAAARGVPPARLVWVHAARQALRPVLGVYGVVIGSLFSGSLAVELVTSWPGLGRLMFDALTSRDVPLVAGCVLAGATFLAAGNFAADTVRAVVDPRAQERT